MRRSGALDFHEGVCVGAMLVLCATGRYLLGGLAFLALVALVWIDVGWAAADAATRPPPRHLRGLRR